MGKMPMDREASFPGSKRRQACALQSGCHVRARQHSKEGEGT